MKLRNIATRIFNDMIDDVNEKWDKTGKPAAFGKYFEDINPEYVEFIRERIQPKFDALLPKGNVRIIIDQYGDLVGELRTIPKSKI